MSWVNVLRSERRCQLLRIGSLRSPVRLPAAPPPRHHETPQATGPPHDLIPLNFLALESLRNLHGSLGDRFTVEMPRGSGSHAHLGAVADEIERRLLRLFLRDADGRRPVNGGNRRFDQDPAWSDRILFYEYFDGETGAGLEASHQTGLTALIAALVASRVART